MHRYEITFSNMKDIKDFVESMQKVSEEVTLHDMKGHVVNAKSLMGCLYSIEYDKIYCISDIDLFDIIEKFIVDGDYNV